MNSTATGPAPAVGDGDARLTRTGASMALVAGASFGSPPASSAVTTVGPLLPVGDRLGYGPHHPARRHVGPLAAPASQLPASGHGRVRIAIAGRAVFRGRRRAGACHGAIQDDLPPLASLLTAVGMIRRRLLRRSRRPVGPWTRVTPSATSVFHVVIMFPFATSSSDGPPVAAPTG